MRRFLSVIFLTIFFFGTSFGQSNNTPNSTYQPGDLVALHWDALPDYDDLQAMIATRELFDNYGEVNYLAVVGTTVNSAKAGTTTLVGNYEHMINMFPTGIDARFKNWPTTTQTVANTWEAILNNGGTIHVAEGGPSEFTARVVNILNNRGVENLKKIRVVQNSFNANERSTSNISLTIVKNLTTYINIDDGNDPNSTPAFNGKHATLEDRNDFKERSLNSDYGPQWSTAYSYVDPQSSPRIIDFSEFVAVMHIFGVETSEYSTISAFADKFFPITNNIVVETTPVNQTPIVFETQTVAVFGKTLPDARNAYANATGWWMGLCKF